MLPHSNATFPQILYAVWYMQWHHAVHYNIILSSIIWYQILNYMISYAMLWIFSVKLLRWNLTAANWRTVLSNCSFFLTFSGTNFKGEKTFRDFPVQLENIKKQLNLCKLVGSAASKSSLSDLCKNVYIK